MRSVIAKSRTWSLSTTQTISTTSKARRALSAAHQKNGRPHRLTSGLGVATPCSAKREPRPAIGITSATPVKMTPFAPAKTRADRYMRLVNKWEQSGRAIAG